MTPNETNQSDGGEGAPLYPKPASIPTSEAEALETAARAIHDRRNPSHTKLAIPDAIFQEYLADARAALAPLRAELSQATERIKELDADVAQARHDADALGTDLQKRVDAYLDERLCCTGQECGCMGITRLEQAIAEEAGSRIGDLRTQLTAARTELEGKRKDSERLDLILAALNSDDPDPQFRLLADLAEKNKSLNRDVIDAALAARSALSGKGEAP